VSYEVCLTFNEPEGVFLAYGFFVLVMIYPVWKLWRIHARAESLRAFVFSLHGFYFLVIILFGLIWLYWVVNTTHTGFWTLHIVDAEHLTLDYWFPRADRLVQPQDIHELTLVTTQKRSKGEVSNRQWAIALVTRQKTAYKSVPILHQDKAKRAIAALENWTGRSHIPYLKDCSDAWGIVCSTSRVSKE
jgi:hypothetical protein